MKYLLHLLLAMVVLGLAGPEPAAAVVTSQPDSLLEPAPDGLVARRRKRRRRRKPAPKPKPQPAPEPAPVEPAMEPAGGGGALRRTTRIEFDAQLIKGQTTKAGEVQILERKDSELKSMVKRRTSFREEIIHTVFPEK